MNHIPSFTKKRKKTYLGGLTLFVLAGIILGYLSFPSENTWIDLHLDHGKLTQAAQLLRKRHARAPNDPIVALKLVDTAMALGNTGEARRIIQAALAVSPDNVIWKRKFAFLLLDENNPRAAAACLAPHERTQDFWIRLAEGYHKISADSLAEDALFTAYGNSPDKAKIWSTVAKWRAERKNAEGEKAALEEVLRHAPQDTRILARLFHNRAETGDIPGALLVADKLRKMEACGRQELETLYQLHHAAGNDDAAGAVLEELIARKDTVPADLLALVSILYNQKHFARAQKLLETLSLRSETLSPEVREAMQVQELAVQSAILFEAGAAGDETAISRTLQEMLAPDVHASPEKCRALLYACLRLSDFFLGRDQENDAAYNRERRDYWLEQARGVFARNRNILPLTEPENARLAADIAERTHDWPGMLNAWRMADRGDGSDTRALLGMARASLHMQEYESAWQNLLTAETRSESAAASQLDLAAHYLAFAAALPDTYPQRQEKQRHADRRARQQLDRSWDDSLARNLFSRNLTTRNLVGAETLLQKLAARGRAAPQDYLGLAEASLAVSREAGKKDNFGKPHGGEAERVRRNALRALAANEPEAWLRLLYIFRVLEDKEQTAGMVQRIERSSMPLDAAALNQLSDAYGFLGDRTRELALLVKRAQMTNRLDDWKNAIDRSYWGGNAEEALRLTGEAEKAYPGNPELMGRRIQIHAADSGQYMQAVRDFQNALERYPDLAATMTARQLATLAAAHEKAGLYGRARQLYRLSLEKEPANWPASSGLASLAKRRGNIAEAVRHVREAIARNPENHWAQLELASLLPDGNRQYNNVIARTKPDGSGAVSSEEKTARALALWRAGRLQEAVRLYQSLLDRQNPHSMNDYAQLLMDAGQYGEARKTLHETMRLFPSHTRAYRLYANCLIRDRDYAGAERSLRGALRSAPRNAEVLRDLAYLQQLQGKPLDAQKSLLKAARR